LALIKCSKGILQLLAFKRVPDHELLSEYLDYYFLDIGSYL